MTLTADAPPQAAAPPSSDFVPEPRMVPESFLLTTGVFEQDLEVRWLPHSNEEHVLIWSERGAVSVVVDDRMHVVLPGCGLWIPRGVVHAGWAAGGAAFRETLFAPESWTPTWDGTTAVDLNAALRHLLIHLAVTGMPEDERLRAQQVCIDLLEPLRFRGIAVPIPQDPRIRKIVDGILRSPADGRSLEQWAHCLNVSPRTISRAFSADVAMSFAQWRRLARMASACTLLAEGATVSVTGRRVGYGTTSAFVAAFHKVVGCTPGELLATE